MKVVFASCALLALALAPACREKKEPKVFPSAGESTVLPRSAVKAPPSKLTRARTSKVRVGDRDRRYVLVEPAAPEPGRHYPLVLVFHGDGGDAESFHGQFPYEQATGEDAYVAYPDGLERTWDLESKLRNREVAFAEALVDQLAAAHPIDRGRVFGTGYSSGGFLSNVIACQNASLFRAIASNAGGAPYKQALVWPNGFTRCPGQAPIAMMALHGGRDGGVTIDSGRFSAAYWAYVNGCRADEMETTGYDECRAYRGCPSGKPVVFCEIAPLGHWVWDQAAHVSWTFFQRT